MHDIRKLVFVGGIHGVGKSTICSQVCATLDIEYISASQVIDDYRNRISKLNKDAEKRVFDINENQNILIKALKMVLAPKKKYLLDGHFTLFDSRGMVRTIPLATFKAIAPSVLVALTDNPALIKKRLQQRDGIEYDEKTLAHMQAKELEHAYGIGIQLDIKVHAVSVHDSENFKNVIVTSLA